jgi:hypothetical protein
MRSPRAEGPEHVDSPAVAREVAFDATSMEGDNSSPSKASSGPALAPFRPRRLRQPEHSPRHRPRGYAAVLGAGSRARWRIACSWCRWKRRPMVGRVPSNSSATTAARALDRVRPRMFPGSSICAAAPAEIPSLQLAICRIGRREWGYAVGAASKMGAAPGGQ